MGEKTEIFEEGNGALEERVSSAERSGVWARVTGFRLASGTAWLAERQREDWLRADRIAST